MGLEKKQAKPRLISLLTVLLFIQTLLILLLGLNLLTDHWTFLFSWPVFWEDIIKAYALVINTPAELERDEILLYNIIAFMILVLGAGASLFSGLTFNRGGPFSWIMSLVAQMATLLTGIGLYLIYRPSQAYWLMAIGILMVLYLNYGDVRQWFLQSEIVNGENLYDS